jgi:Protein of unknown function (DUF3047)
MSRFVAAAMLGCAAIALSGCTSAPTTAPERADAAAWHAVALPGKRATQYHWEHKEGRRALAARAQGSASLWRRNVVRPAEALGPVEFSWWVQAVPALGDVSDADHEDAAARVVFAFAGDARRLSARNQMQFELAHVLTGEPPPFATLMYVWDARLPVGSVIVNPRSDRIRKIVVESGESGLRQWRNYRRHLVDDFRMAFGEAPGALQALAVMTDGDNTGSALDTWYGEITLY